MTIEAWKEDFVLFVGQREKQQSHLMVMKGFLGQLSVALVSICSFHGKATQLLNLSVIAGDWHLQGGLSASFESGAMCLVGLQNLKHSTLLALCIHSWVQCWGEWALPGSLCMSRLGLKWLSELAQSRAGDCKTTPLNHDRSRRQNYLLPIEPKPRPLGTDKPSMQSKWLY